MRPNRILFLGTLLSVAATLFAGTTVDVSGVYRLEITSEISPREAMDRAYEAAKKAALEKVVGTHVRSWESMVSDSKTGEGFSSLMLQTSQGFIRKFDVRKTGWRIEEIPNLPDGLLNVFCDARVTVEKTDDEPDPEFTCKIDGARVDYRDGERAKFTVIASQEAYLTVFLLDARLGGEKVFPNRTFRKNALEAEEPRALPQFTFMKTNAGKAREQGVLMFVITKKNVPFLAPSSGRVSADEINAWLADIPADERFFRVFPFSISPEGEALR